jgi:hypothetical protein
MFRLLLVVASACSTVHAPATRSSPRPVKPLAVLDDLKPCRYYSALVVNDNKDGTHTIDTVTLMATDYAQGTRRVGWIWHNVRTLDARFERVVDQNIMADWSGWGLLEFPADVQWLGLTEVASADKAAERKAIARHVAGEPSPTLASLVPAEAPMVPDGFVPRVTLRMLGVGELRVSFVLHDIVFGDGVTATRDLDDGRLHIAVTLTPDAPRAPTAGRATAEFKGTLAVHLEDDRGHAVDRSVAVTGPIELEGDTVIAPSGFQIAHVTPKLCGALDCMFETLTLPAAGGREARSIHLEHISTFDVRSAP